MPVNLTANAISAIVAGDVNAKPLVQILDVKLAGATQDRYRLLISDSVLVQQAMLATQLNGLVKAGGLRKGSVVQLIEYICTYIQNRKIIVVLNMEIIIPDCDIIGNPKMLDESDSAVQKSVPERPFLSAASDNNNNHLGAQNAVRSNAPFRNNVNSSNLASSAQSFRPVVQPPYQPPPNFKGHGAIMKNEAPARIIPIAALNPYQGRWAIKARVTAKGNLRRYNNAKGDGKVFSFDLLDSDGGEIRATCFNAVVDRFYDVIEVGKVYIISKGSLKAAKKDFNHLKNEWEIFLESSSTVDLCPDEDAIPPQQFSFRPISDIESAENNSILDVIGVVINVNPSVPIMRKNGMETQRRILNLKDKSGKSVELTLWGDFCNREGQQLQALVEAGHFPVVAVKAGKVNDFTGKSIGTISSTQIFIDLDHPEAHSLRDWFDRGGKDIASHSISKEIMPGGSKNEVRKFVSQIKDEGLGRADKPDWVTVKATISFIKTDTFCYTACPLMIGDRQCNKKVTRSVGNSRWLCERCNQEFEECDYRYLLQIQIQDHSGLTWVTAFQEAGEEILGCSAKELYLLKNEEQDELRYAEIIRNCLFTEYLFRLKIKEEIYGDEQRVKLTVVKADKVNSSAECRYLLDSIARFSAR
ncbi:OLC1v1037845C1 [Oldenlandia corymbosa var. corymbosa]|uniref:Replication protein A subunit n=1 Tax=Oldenlandia corymbosa var. corymbosa TaxID=529605 RepID=A0AAV1CYG2_OLDCO|nr:OLC1v1037845C1 [Oldenlandia corymbosa var. corymbosa]